SKCGSLAGSRWKKPRQRWGCPRLRSFVTGNLRQRGFAASSVQEFRTMGRWEQIESIFYEALERPESQREAYVQQACANDAELHREVSSLIQSSSDEAAFGPWAAAAAAKL